VCALDDGVLDHVEKGESVAPEKGVAADLHTDRMLELDSSPVTAGLDLDGELMEEALSKKFMPTAERVLRLLMGRPPGAGDGKESGNNLLDARRLLGDEDGSSRASGSFAEGVRVVLRRRMGRKCTCCLQCSMLTANRCCD